MGIFQANIKILNTFLNHFKAVFSQKQFAVLTLLFYSLFKDYKRCSIQSLAHQANTDYQQFQYFISEAKWSVDDLTSARLKLLHAQKSTSSSQNGILIINDCSIPIKVVIMFGKWHKDDEASHHVFITNNTSISAYSIISTYMRRWCIEQVFRELKDSFALDQYQVRSKTSIERYWHLCLLAWTCLYWIKQNAYLSKIITDSKSLITFNDFKLAIASLIDYSSVAMLSRSQKMRNHCFRVKSKRFINSCAKAA